MWRAGARLTLESCEAFVAFLCLLSSAAYLSGTPSPKSIDALLPVWLRVAWGGYLFAGGLLTLAGLSIGRRRTEKAGLLLLAGSGFVYALALSLVGGVAALFPVGITWAFAAAFGLRASDRVQAAALRVLRDERDA